MNNAFTLKETLVVLLIVMILSSFSIPRASNKLVINKIEEACLSAQMLAYSYREKQDVAIGEKEADIGRERIVFPADFVCEPLSFHYNEKGNISKGGTLRCVDGKKSYQLVFQIGMGRMRLE